MKVANTSPSPNDMAIGAKNAASPLVSNIKVNRPAKVVKVVKIIALNLFLACLLYPSRGPGARGNLVFRGGG